MIFQLTRPLRGATAHQLLPLRGLRISTHTPLAGRDHFDGRSAGDVCRFQLTRPLRGATIDAIFVAVENSISTHTPLAGRDVRNDCDQ